jgi:uncharacterized membrane protein
MSEVQNRPNQFPFQDRINIVTVDQCFVWLGAGWRDLKAAAGASLAYGLFFSVAGLLLTIGLFLSGMDYLIVPMIEGFFLIGPALTIGFHSISRDLQNDRRPTFFRAIAAWRVNSIYLIVMGLALVLFLIIWARTAVILFAIWFPYTSLDLQSMVNAIFFTLDGYIFLAVGTAFGAVFAAIIFVAGSLSLPMMLDKKNDLMQAVIISCIAVTVNIRPMLFWAAIIVVVIGAGLATAYVGLIVALPLVGHASWHAYQAIIKDPPEDSS